jgi:hypothetical protein
MEDAGIALSVMNVMAVVFIVVVGTVAAALVVLFIIDRFQTEHAIRRNFPVIGRLRTLLEHLGVFFRQYFFAMDREEMPFNRAERAWVYRAAKNLDNTSTVRLDPRPASGGHGPLRQLPLSHPDTEDRLGRAG